MKSTELRIGNIIDMGREGIGMVSGYNLYQKSVQENGGSVSDYYNEWKPIPLNEEWLMKFWFEKPAHSWNGKIFHLSEWDDSPLNWAVAMDKNGSVIVKKLKYVHQLQNLYFALTQEELTFKTN